MSALYFDILKDRLYTFSAWSKGRRSAQTALCDILSSLATLMAPILSFTAEEVWKHIPGSNRTESVFFASFPESRSDYLDEALHEKWERIWEVRMTVTKALEEARKNRTIGHSLDAQVHLHLPEKLYTLLQPYEADLKSIFIVSSVVLSPAVPGTDDEKEMRVEVRRAEGKKCERCWNYDTKVGLHPQHQTLCGRCVEAIH